MNLIGGDKNIQDKYNICEVSDKCWLSIGEVCDKQKPPRPAV